MVSIDLMSIKMDMVGDKSVKGPALIKSGLKWAWTNIGENSPKLRSFFKAI